MNAQPHEYCKICRSSRKPTTLAMLIDRYLARRDSVRGAALPPSARHPAAGMVSRTLKGATA